jgi:hypothetical protein
MPSKIFRKNTTCSNCNTEIANANFCHNCGQANTHKVAPVKELVNELISEFWTFDSKFFKSFVPLLRKPGLLTNHYLAGKRNTYIFPLRIYILSTVLFFLLLAISNKFKHTVKNQDEIPMTIDSLQIFVEEEFPEMDSIKRDQILNFFTDNFYIISNKNFSSEYKSRSHVKKMIEDFKLNLSDSVKQKFINYYKFETYSVDDVERDANDTIGFTAKKDFSESIELYKKSNSDSVVEKFKNKLLNTYSVNLNYTYDTSLIKTKKKKNGLKINSNDSSFEKFFKDKYLTLGKTDTERETNFWKEVNSQFPKVMFLVMPLFALILKLLYVRRKILYINHLIFSLHVHSILFIYILIALVWSKWYIITSIVFAILFHLYFALRNVYGQSFWKIFLKLLILIFTYIFVLSFAFVGLLLAAIWLA